MTPDRWMAKAAELFPYEVQDDGTPASKLWRAIYDTKRFEIAASLRAVEIETLERAANEVDCGGPPNCREPQLKDGTCVRMSECPHAMADDIRSLKSTPPRADEGP